MKKIVTLLLIMLLLICGIIITAIITTPIRNRDTERTKVKNNAKIIVYKKEHRLEVYDDDKLCTTMKVVIGFTPIGHKQREGDGKTPEGEYYICYRNPDSSYYLSVGLSYPNIEDAKAGLEQEAISQEDYDQIVNSIESGGQPPWKTPLGGEIMIHGHGIRKDHTAGCIALADSDMQYIWDNCTIGTPVIIKP